MRAYVVSVDVGPTEGDDAVAQEIFDVLSDAGFDVTSVNPHSGEAPTVTPEGLVPPTQLPV